MAVYLNRFKTQYMRYTSAAMAAAIADAQSVENDKIVALVAQFRFIDTNVTAGSPRIISLGDSSQSGNSRERSVMFISGEGRGYTRMQGTLDMLNSTARSVGDQGGIYLASNRNGQGHQFGYIDEKETDTETYAWTGDYDQISLGVAASADTPSSGQCISTVLQHVAVVAVDELTTEMQDQILGLSGEARLTPPDIFTEDEIIVYFPLVENLEATIYPDETAPSFAVSGGYTPDDIGTGVTQDLPVTQSQGDNPGVYLGEYKPDTIERLYPTTDRLEDSPVAAQQGTVRAEGYDTPIDVLIRSIQPSTDGIKAAEGESSEHVRPMCQGHLGTQIGIGSSVARIYYRQQGETDWTRTDWTQGVSWIFAFNGGDVERFIVVATDDTWYTATIDQIINYVVSTNEPTAASTQPELVIDGDPDPQDINWPDPASSGRQQTISEAVTYNSVGTNPDGYAVFLPYSNPAGDSVKKLWMTDDWGASWTEISDFDNAYWQSVQDSDYAGVDNYYRLKHGHGVLWVPALAKFWCFHGDGYLQSGAFTVDPSVSNPNVTQDSGMLWDSQQGFTQDNFEGKVIVGADRTIGVGFYDPNTADFTELERFKPPINSIRHSFYARKWGGIAYWGPHTEGTQTNTTLAAAPIIVAKAIDGLIQIAASLSRQAFGNTSLPRIDTMAGLNNGKLACQITDSDGSFKHYELTPPVLRKVKGMRIHAARTNYYPGNLSQNGDVSTLAGIGDHTANQGIGPDGEANTAIKLELGGSNLEANSGVLILCNPLAAYPNDMTRFGMQAVACFKSNIELALTLEAAFSTNPKNTMTQGIAKADRWQNVRFFPTFRDAATLLFLRVQTGATIDGRGPGSYHPGTNQGEIYIANIGIGRPPMRHIPMNPSVSDPGDANLNHECASIARTSITSGADGLTVLMHVTPVQSWWEHIGNERHATNPERQDRKIIANIVDESGNFLRLTAAPIRHSTIDTYSDPALAVDDAIFENADLVGNQIVIAQDGYMRPSFNVIEARNSDTSVDLENGVIVTGSTGADATGAPSGYHAWLNSMELWLEDYDSSGAFQDEVRLGRFEAHKDVAIPVAVSVGSLAAIAYHAAEGKLVASAGVNPTGTFTSMTDGKLVHGDMNETGRIFDHEVTVVEVEQGQLDATEIETAFNTAAITPASGGAASPPPAFTRRR